MGENKKAKQEFSEKDPNPRLYFEKEVNDCGRKYLMLKVAENIIEHSCLPDDYTQGEDVIFMDMDTKTLTVIHNEEVLQFSIGGEIIKTKFDYWLLVMKRALKRCKEAKEKIKKTKKEWKGELIIEI